MASELNVYQRIHAVMNDIETIQKTGRNDFHKYDYATEADYVHALRPLLKKYGLVVIPSLGAQPVVHDNGVTAIMMKFTIVNVDKPEEKVESIIPAQGQDKGDKGIYKALTGAKKYFAALTFMVATGDDPEKDEKGLGKGVALTKPVLATTNATLAGTANGSGAAAPSRASFRKSAVVAEKTVAGNDDI